MDHRARAGAGRELESARCSSWLRIAVFACALGYTNGSARAQTLPAWLRVRPEYLAEEVRRVPDTEPEASDADKRSHRRASYLIAAGAGMMLGGIVNAATFGSKGGWCYEHDARVTGALHSGSILAGVGAVLALVGGAKLKRLPRGSRESGPALGGKLLLTGLGSAVATLAVPSVFYLDQFGCISS